MALEKKELDNFLPNGFETLNQEGYKENFTEDKIQTGYEKDVPDLVSGPNLNNLIDKVGKNFNVLDGVNKYLNNMPIDSIPIVNSNNQLDYINKEEIGGASMPIGTIFAHTCTASFVPENSLPCDGTEYAQTQFQKFYTDWLVGKRLNTCTYEEYQQEISTYGKCAKFGLDTETGKFKVPTIPDGTFIQQAMSDDELGKSYKAGLPNVTGVGGIVVTTGIDGCHYVTNELNKRDYGSGTSPAGTLNTDLSRFNPIYGNSNTVQPEAVALRFFVVVATKAINESEMDWSEWASSLASKANVSDIDGVWVGTAQTVFSNVSFSAQEIKTYDLNAYLPNDNKIYEVIFDSRITTGSNTGDTAYIKIGTSVLNSEIIIIGTQTPTTRQVLARASAIIPIGADRQIKVKNDSAADTAVFELYVRGYRKVR